MLIYSYRHDNHPVKKCFFVVQKELIAKDRSQAYLSDIKESPLFLLSR